KIVLFELRRANAVPVFVNPLYLYRYARVRNFRLQTFVRKNKKPSAAAQAKILSVGIRLF
ncbi:TPA: hypothetical protein ACMZ5P_002242, partial [Neisseria gonorrhoeae]